MLAKATTRILPSNYWTHNGRPAINAAIDPVIKSVPPAAQ